MLTIDRVTPSAYFDHDLMGVRSACEHKDHVRSALAELGQLEYGWDGAGTLPIRGDAQTFAVSQLCDPDVGVYGFYGVEAPEVSLLGDGRIVIWFSNDLNDRSLELAIPCSNVVVAKKFDDGYSVEERLSQDRPSLAEELNDLCHWLKAKVKS